jgi:amino acid transporter/mannitol/fructose-specific phosphotransferase system IIA component (Ntr-type)
MALKRQLGPAAVFAVAAGAMISSGLFVLPWRLFPMAGAGMFICYLGAALLLVPSVLSKAELVTAMPKAGGDYYFIDRSLGPGFGTVGGIAAWASLSLKSAFSVLGIGLLVSSFCGLDPDGWQVKAVACGSCILLAGVNLTGAKPAGRLQIALVALLLTVLGGYVVWGMGAIQAARYEHIIPEQPTNLLKGMAVVFIAFGGVTKVASLGEDVRDPKKDIVKGMFAACAIVSLLYVLVAFVTVGLLPAESGQWTSSPLAQAGGLLWGRPGMLLLSVAALSAFVTTANAGILSASRVAMAMSGDRLLPGMLAGVSARRGVPSAAILFTALFMAAVVLLPLELFIKAASAMKILLFMLTMLSLVLMRESRIASYNPSWRCPLYPWMQIAGIVIYGFLLVELGTAALALGGLVLAGAVVWYALYARLHVLRESALVRIAARLVEADFDEHDLEAELSRVVRERDQVVTDRFDLLIQECALLDIEGRLSRRDVFEAAARELAQKVGLTADGLAAMLGMREGISTTVIRPGLAIPHVIHDGIESVQIVVVRSREGVVFVEGQPPVHIIFVLAASPSERNFYLKALMAIAEIAQEPDFDRRWMRASNSEALREVLLAAERRRELAHGESGPVSEAD